MFRAWETQEPTKRVLDIRQAQGTILEDDVDDIGGGLVRLPTVALFECCTILGYEFDDSGKLAALSLFL